MKADGKIILTVLKSMELQPAKNFSHVVTEIITIRTITFTLPNDIAHNVNLNPIDIMAFFGGRGGGYRICQQCQAKNCQQKNLIHYVLQ
jgi:hypothetical protein